MNVWPPTRTGLAYLAGQAVEVRGGGKCPSPIARLALRTRQLLIDDGSRPHNSELIAAVEP